MTTNGILLCMELLIAANSIAIAIHGTRIWSALLDIRNELRELRERSEEWAQKTERYAVTVGTASEAEMRNTT